MADAIDRRTFLGSGLAVGIAGTVGPTPLRAWRLRKRPTAFAPPDFELEETTIIDLQAKMGSGGHTARTLAEAYLARIEALDRDGPALRAWSEPTLLRLAYAFEQATRARRPPTFAATAPLPL